jgi:hypothetical protein
VSALGDLVTAIAAGRWEFSGPVVGSEANPYLLYVPGWLEDKALEQGETLQEVADRVFLPHVKVVVVQ